MDVLVSSMNRTELRWSVNSLLFGVLLLERTRPMTNPTSSPCRTNMFRPLSRTTIVCGPITAAVTDFHPLFHSWQGSSIHQMPMRGFGGVGWTVAWLECARGHEYNPPLRS